jgi:hypothetical protein
MINVDTPITDAEKEAFRSFMHSSIKTRLDLYLQDRAKRALADSCIEATKGNALKTVSQLCVYNALDKVMDDFSSQFS